MKYQRKFSFSPCTVMSKYRPTVIENMFLSLLILKIKTCLIHSMVNCPNIHLNIFEVIYFCQFISLIYIKENNFHLKYTHNVLKLFCTKTFLTIHSCPVMSVMLKIMLHSCESVISFEHDCYFAMTLASL